MKHNIRIQITLLNTLLKMSSLCSRESTHNCMKNLEIIFGNFEIATVYQDNIICLWANYCVQTLYYPNAVSLEIQIIIILKDIEAKSPHSQIFALHLFL